MKITKLNLSLRFIIGVFILAILLQSCGNDTEGKKTWFRDPNGSIHTKDVKIVQPEIPFTIVIPSYLPSILGTDYSWGIIGPIKYNYTKEIEVQIGYFEEPHQIYISERNVMQVMEPTKELNPVYLDIAGVNVLREKAQMAGSTGITEGLSFDWNQNGLSFTVKVFSINEEEGIKVVESMIKQTQ